MMPIVVLRMFVKQLWYIRVPLPLCSLVVWNRPEGDKNCCGPRRACRPDNKEQKMFAQQKGWEVRSGKAGKCEVERPGGVGQVAGRCGAARPGGVEQVGRRCGETRPGGVVKKDRAVWCSVREGKGETNQEEMIVMQGRKGSVFSTWLSSVAKLCTVVFLTYTGLRPI